VTLRPIAPSLVALILLALLLLNIADAFITSIAVVTGIGKEMNPLMDWMLRQGTDVFIIFKMMIGPVVVGTLFVFRRRKLAAYGTLFVTSLYFIVCCYHLYGVLTTGVVPGIGPI